ncbi:hypothetical protein FCOIX_11234 [Fusarium coicis]|nr:hypothetical protein FCOIX_11234 [Fusarium coicis]
MSDQIPSQWRSEQRFYNGNGEQSYYSDCPPAQYQVTPSFFPELGTYYHSGPVNTELISSESDQSSLAGMAPISSSLIDINGDGRAFVNVVRLEPTALDISKSITRSTVDRVQSW